MDTYSEHDFFAPSLGFRHLVKRQSDLPIDETLSDPNLVPDALRELEDSDLTNASMDEYIRKANMSSREYDAYVYSLEFEHTGCKRKGALPVPIASNDTCLPGFFCKSCTGICLLRCVWLILVCYRSELKLLQSTPILPSYRTMSSQTDGPKHLSPTRSL